MHHFFVSPERIRSDEIYLQGADVRHMNSVLRMKAGEQLTVSDQCGNRYTCRLERYEQKNAVLTILQKEDDAAELPARIYLFQGLAKGEKMEWIIQKAVELGVHEIIPVETGRSIVRLDAQKAEKKAERWQAIAEGAAKQSGRGIIPVVHGILTYQAALEYAAGLDVLLIPYERADDMNITRQALGGIFSGQTAGIFIGPEGGFAEPEIELAVARGIRPVTLGRRILRTETAGLAVLSILMYHLES